MIRRLQIVFGVDGLYGRDRHERLYFRIADARSADREPGSQRLRTSGANARCWGEGAKS
jgi:hypothetical protein